MVKFIHPLAMFGRQPQGFAKAEVIRIVKPLVRRFAFGFVHRQNHAARVFTQNSRQNLIGGGDTYAAINQEQANVGHSNRAFRQRPHAPLKALVRGFFQSGGVDHGESKIAQLGVAFAKIARNPRRVIDQRQFLPNQTVKQCRFPDVRTPDYCQCKRHNFT